MSIESITDQLARGYRRAWARIAEHEVPEARKMGLRIHHCTDCGRDDWYAGSEEFVADYHRSGGMWEYAD